MVTLRIAFHTSLLKSVKNSRSMATSMKVREVIGDTIFALSSSGSYSTKTGVAVVRISGPHAYYCLSELLKKDPSSIVSLPSARQASLRRLFCPGSGDLLDQALVLCFPSPRSFTGEDVVELHTHGSRAVIQSLFTAFEDINKQLSRTEVNRVGVVRPADRGEFTRRAFENGKMDLTEVEGLSDLLDAETSAQRKQALRQMEGYLRIKFEAWREELKGCLAYTEAVIDFGDDDREDDINDSTMYALLPRVQELRDELEYYLKDGRKGEIVREGVRIALVGKPNAGKSSLLNCLAKRPAAIVSPVAGTTRDVVEVRMDLEGVSCIVSDTAGLRLGLDTTTDEIEIEGMRRAREAFKAAQIKVFVHDATDSSEANDPQTLLSSLLLEEGGSSDDEEAEFRTLMVYNKKDLRNSSGLVHALADSKDCCEVSCVTGEGIIDLELKISTAIKGLLRSDRLGGEDNALITRERHRRHVTQCVEHLNMFLSAALPMDAAAEELRLAMQELGRVTGRVDVEELLDIIFRDFCIGK